MRERELGMLRNPESFNEWQGPFSFNEGSKGSTWLINKLDVMLALLYQFKANEHMFIVINPVTRS